jgi:transposase
MSISQEDLFRVALGSEKTLVYQVNRVKVEENQLGLTSILGVAAISCPFCSKSCCSVHYTIERTWRHLNFFQFRTYLHYRVPRTECDKCGVKQVKVPWARKSSGFTLLMDSLIVLLAQHMPVKTVADLIGEHDTRI